MTASSDSTAKMGSVLPTRATQLANDSINAALGQRQQAWLDHLRSIVTELSSKGIVSGPMVAVLTRAAIAEIDGRKKLVASELVRAAESAGVTYHPKLARDLGEAYDAILHGLPNDVLERGRVSAALSDAEREQFESVVNMWMASRGVAYSDLMHFAEQLRTQRRSTWYERLWNLAVLVIGALLGAALTLATQSLTPHH